MGAETLVIRKANLTDLERLAELEAESFEWAWDEQMLMEHMFREFVHYFVLSVVIQDYLNYQKHNSEI